MEKSNNSRNVPNRRITLLINKEMHKKLKKKAEQVGIPINQYILTILSKEV